MKKTISLFLVISMLILVSGSSIASGEGRSKGFAGGTGSVVDPYIIFTENQLESVRNDPNANYVSVSQNDSEDGYCRCDKCSAKLEEMGTVSAVYIDFVNRVANEIKDEYPNVTIHTFAYRFTRQSPIIDIKAADNVMVHFCTYEADRRYPLTTYAERVGDKYNENDDFAKLLEEWAKVSDNMGIWCYTTNFSNYCELYPNFEAIRQDIRFFAENNVKYIFVQGAYQSANGEFSELRSYLIAKLLWDPFMSEEQYYTYMYEFMSDYYGPGWENIKEYITLATDLTEELGICNMSYYNGVEIQPHEFDEYPEDLTAEKIRDCQNQNWLEYWNFFYDRSDDTIISEGRRLFDAAYAMAETDEQREHISKSEIQLRLMELEAYQRKLSVVPKSPINNILDNYFSNNPDEFTDEEQREYKKNITGLIFEQRDQSVFSLKKSLYEDMLKYEINCYREVGGLTENLLSELLAENS